MLKHKHAEHTVSITENIKNIHFNREREQRCRNTSS